MPEPTRAERLLAALREITEENGGESWSTASELAFRARIRGNRRNGNGAVAGTWSGYTAPAFAAAPTLRAMARRGEIRERWADDGYGRSRKVYSLPLTQEPTS